MRQLVESLHAFAKMSPAALALVDNARSLSYSELWISVVAASRALHSLDIKKGDRVAVIATKRTNTVSVMLGAMRSGIIVIPINPLLKPGQILHILHDCGARLLFMPGQSLPSLDGIIKDCESLNGIVLTDAVVQNVEGEDSVDNTLDQHKDHLSMPLRWEVFMDRAQNTNDQKSEPLDDEPAAILYTSGSTGKPKGVVFTHANLAHGAYSVSQYLANVPEDRILALMPLSFDYGLSQLTTALSVGACTVLFEYFLPRGVLDAVSRYQITGLPAVPHVWDQLANLSWPHVPHLRYMTNTGGRMSDSTSFKLTRKLPHTHLYLMYGFTEAFRSTYLPPEQVMTRPGSIGKAVPHAQVLVVDDEGNEVQPDTVGELIHSGPLVTAGYWNDPALTQTKFRPRYRHDPNNGDLFAWSGDLVSRDEDGFLYFVSRRDEQVKLRGFRVHPAEIEEVIARCELVQEVCVVCVPHREFKNVAIAVIVGANVDVTDDVEFYCRSHLPGYMVPDLLVQVDALPAGPNNKIDRQQLVETYHHAFEQIDSGTRAL